MKILIRWRLFFCDFKAVINPTLFSKKKNNRAPGNPERGYRHQARNEYKCLYDTYLLLQLINLLERGVRLIYIRVLLSDLSYIILLIWKKQIFRTVSYLISELLSMPLPRRNYDTFGAALILGFFKSDLLLL